MKEIKLSVVTTLFRSENYLEEFHNRITSEAKKISSDYEIIYVNDGSPDASAARIIDLIKKDHNAVLVDLTRNFGHHAAMLAGIEESSGDLVFLIDSDLEEKPEWLGLFYDKLQEKGADVVYGKQVTRKGRFFERITGYIFYSLFNMLSQISIPANLTMARLMKREYVDALLQFQEKTVFLGGIFELVGFNQVGISVDKGAKKHTTYTIGRRISLLVNAITSFTEKPLMIVFNMGILISSIAVVYSIYLIISRIFFQVYLSGWPSLIVSVWFLSGLIIASIGVVGIYISKIFQETKNRPRHLVRKVYRSGS